MKIFEDLSNSKKPGFQCEKGVKWWHGPDFTSKRRKEAIPTEWMADIADLGSQSLIFDGERLNTNVFQELLWQHVVPLVQRTYPGRKASYGSISTGPHCQDHSAVVGGILDSGRMAAIFAGLESAGLHHLAGFAGKRQSNASCKLTPYVRPWPRNGTG